MQPRNFLGKSKDIHLFFLILGNLFIQGVTQMVISDFLNLIILGNHEKNCSSSVESLFLKKSQRDWLRALK